MIANQAKELIIHDDKASALAKLQELVTIVKSKPYMDIPSSSELTAMLQEEEDAATTARDEFASLIQKTDNYYVIVTRDSIPSLPYSAEEIYGIRNSGKYGTLKQTYNEFYHLYQMGDVPKYILPDVVIVEDSNSGYQFFSNVFQGTETECIEAGGKQETLYLNSIEGMAESIVEGGNITIDECIPEDMVDW